MIALVADQQFTIFITEDNLFAYLELLPAKDPDLEAVSLEQILKALESAKICRGIEENSIADTLQLFYTTNASPAPVLIARGQRPEHQQTRGIYWFIDPLAKHDYERVAAPDHPIGHEISHLQGKPGLDIFGIEIPAQNLPDIMISEGGGVYTKIIKDEQSNDQTWFYSHFLGVVNLRDERLTVQSLIWVDERFPFDADIELFGFLGDETHTKVNAYHIMETLKRMNISHGWDAKLLIKVLHLAHRRKLSELERDTKKSLRLVSSKKPSAALLGDLKWDIKQHSVTILDRIVGPGQTIASYECLVEGEAGMDVYGHEILPNDQTEHFPGVGDYIELFKGDNHYKYRAQTLGIVAIEEDISLQSLLEIRDDKLIAYINLPVFPKETDSRVISLAQIQTTLEFDKICYGLKIEDLKKTVSQIQVGQQGADEDSYFFKTMAAHGKEAVDGIDANIELNTKISAGKLMKNGRIDFKERSYPWDVEQGDEIGYIVPIVPGIDGIDIYNNIIEAKPAEELELVLNGLHRTSAGQILADREGTLIVSKNALTVTDSLILDGDIDNLTGNINTDSTVIVKGHIQPGFRLVTTADICIEANIENAVAKAGGNIIIQGGVRGNGSIITADGEVNVTFMENAEVYSKESIITAESLISCQLEALEEVIVGENEDTGSNIVGGRIHAQKKVSAGNLGNEINIKTDIIAGYTQKEQDDFYAISKKINFNEFELDRIENLYVSGSEGDENMARLKDKLELLGLQIEEQKKQHSFLNKLIHEGVNSTVEFHNNAYPGVNVTICGNNLLLKQVYKTGKFYLKGKKVMYKAKGK